MKELSDAKISVAEGRVLDFGTCFWFDLKLSKESSKVE